ncbi:MAG: extracellular solute-binding protein [Moraxellaceae bacterium]|nr:extracellular solute-binding protein [Moraxellaceae bacterium]
MTFLMRYLSIALTASLGMAAQAAVETTHAISLHGKPAYPAGFKAFSYVNPAAPKGGDIRLYDLGSFDSLNPFINKGNAANVTRIYDSLTTASLDEPFTRYGLLAEKIERDPDDASWVTYHLNPAARFSDGKPVTAADVVFTFDIIRKEGDPSYKAYFADVTKVEALDTRRVKFTFRDANNRELPLIVGELSILPKHYWEKRNFNSTSLDIPVGSGPYIISRVDAGRSITYTLNPDYWGKELPVNRGHNNFNSITTVYYRDTTVAFEGFKAGQYDFRVENRAKTWATEYNFPATRNGLVKKNAQPHQNSSGMQGFGFNLRRPIFQDVKVREALGLAFDFEWSNRTLFNMAYTRTDSYFSNSELGAKGSPSAAELTLLEPFRAQLPASVFAAVQPPPKTDGSGNARAQLLKAQQLLASAGWTIKNGKLVNAQNQPMAFEILLAQPEFERIVQPFRQNLARLGIDMRIRIVDVSQYVERMRRFDYDMTVVSFAQSQSPGNEQRDFWSSQAADTAGSRNSLGIKNPAVDKLVDHIIAAPSREALVTATRALDRVLLANHYVIPHFHVNAYRLAYWDFLERPATSPRYSLGFDTWWVNPQKLQRIRAAQGNRRQ